MIENANIYTAAVITGQLNWDIHLPPSPIVSHWQWCGMDQVKADLKL